MVLLFLCCQASAQQFNYNFDSLKRVISLRPDDTGSVKAYVDYSAKFFYVKSDSGLYYIDRAIALASKKKDSYLYLFCLKNKGDFYSIGGDFKTGEKIYKLVLATPSAPQSWLIKIKVKGNLAIAYKNQGMLDSAQLVYQDVIRAFAIHKNNHADSLALAFSYIQLFDLYQVQGLMDEALYYGQKGYELSLKLKLERGIGYGLYIQALKYQTTNQELALSYCDRALKLSIDKSIPDLEQFARALKAKVYIGQKRYRDAELVMLPALKLTAGSAQQVTCAKLAEIYYYLDNLPKAVVYFQRSYQLAKTSGYHAELAEALANGVAIYEKAKDYKTAFRLQQEYQHVQQLITSDKLKLDYQRSALKFKTVEKDKELAQKQLLIAQKDIRLNRQSFLIFVSVALIFTALIWWWVYSKHQRKLREQQALVLKAAGDVQSLEAMIQGEETERQRIAKDLHDGIGGLLSAIKMRFSTIKNEYPELKASPSFQQVIAMLDDASAEIRKTAHNLMPDMLTRFGLDEAVQIFCSHISQRNQLIVDYQSVGYIGRFQDNFELSLYRIVQELLNNTIKHAGASHALVQFTRQEDLLTISIEDDGKGFDYENANTDIGIGLKSVKDRVRSFNGIMEVETAPGSGTAIYLEFEVGKVSKRETELNESENSYS